MPVLHHRVVQPLHSEYSCRLGGPQHLSELRRGRPLRFQARACLFILLVRRKQCGFSVAWFVRRVRSSVGVLRLFRRRLCCGRS